MWPGNQLIAIKNPKYVIYVALILASFVRRQKILITKSIFLLSIQAFKRNKLVFAGYGDIY
jgi:hypothetical protein